MKYTKWNEECTAERLIKDIKDAEHKIMNERSYNKGANPMKLRTTPAVRCDWCNAVTIEGDEVLHAEDCDAESEDTLMDFDAFNCFTCGATWPTEHEARRCCRRR